MSCFHLTAQLPVSS